MSILNDFKKRNDVEESIVRKFSDRVPEQIAQLWKQNGFGSFINGYLKIINPNDYIDIVSNTYLRNEGTIPLFATSMCDVILYERDSNEESYIVQLNYRKGKSKVIASKYTLFIRFLEEVAFREKALDWQPYPEAVQKYGEPAYDECFGYVPLLGLGGPEKVENLQKVKLREHILLISEFMGPIK